MSNIYALRIREVRQRENKTQEEFAESIGTTKNQLSKYELGIQDTPTKIIRAVCDEYNVDANWLLGLTETAVAPTRSRRSKSAAAKGGTRVRTRTK